MKKYVFCFVLCLISLFSEDLKAQNFEASSSLSNDSITPGQGLQLTISLIVPNNAVVQWPMFIDTLSKDIEIVDKQDLKKTVDGDNMLYSQNLKITSFAVGENEVPTLGLNFQTSDSIGFTAYTNPIEFYVYSVEVDTTQAIRDIKQPLRQPITFKEAASVAGIVIALVALALLIVYLVRRMRTKQREPEKSAPPVPAIDMARTQLSELKLKQLWQAGKLKEYYTELTDIVRQYIEGQFSVQAVELTTPEILSEVKTLNINAQVSEKLKDALELSDLVKFAKYQPVALDNDNAFNFVNDFIEESYAYYLEEQQRKAEQEKQNKASESEITKEEEI